ncbi:putative transcription factor interactor and regulator C3H-WRC/GRF family [Lupinus albus]|uniref:Growth-regulating factor n=1 Tax=Lupinus albus TaxID=3870 RepID=A0A6A4Q5Q0_LUPAL|nr:putative transcription factor interactor and regulator C3H-WRC/GRF family [Lupinus albus]
MGEFGVSHKEANKSSVSTSTTTSSVVGLGLKKLQHTLEAFPSNKNNMMMLHHNHHHHPLSQPFDNDLSVAAPGDGDGPVHTTYMSNLSNHINLVATTGSYSALGAGAIHDDASVPVRTLQQQPFDISGYYTSGTTTYPAFKSSEVMAASLGFPFTSAQWKELERQAMIYKYMMASIPIPPDLLIPTVSRSTLNSGFNLRLSGNDPEPGRCRRTDGKKWRCSRDVAPNHKYCERHMHRGRPRSRKPVEVHINNNNNNNNQNQIKRARHDSNPFSASDVSVSISNNTTTKKDGCASQFVSSGATKPYLDTSSLPLHHNFGVKTGNFDSVASVSSNKEPRGLEWMLNGDPISLGASDSEFHSLMHNKVGNTEPQYLNSFALYNSGVLDQQNRRSSMFRNALDFPMESLQSPKPRGYIDAWSTEESNGNTNKSNVASIGKFSLDLSMGGGRVHEDIGTIDMGLGLMENGNNTKQNDTKTHLSNWLTPSSSSSHWVASTTLGGPLAEVLRPSTITNDAASNQSSSVITHAESSSNTLGTLVSPPSGVLHKTIASFSDSSSNSSPRVGSSRASNSDIALLRFN